MTFLPKTRLEPFRTADRGLRTAMAAIGALSPKSPKVPPFIPGLVNREEIDSFAQRELEEIGENQLKLPEDPAPTLPVADPWRQLDSLTRKVDQCLEEILNVKVKVTSSKSEDRSADAKGPKKSPRLRWTEVTDGDAEGPRQAADPAPSVDVLDILGNMCSSNVPRKAKDGNNVPRLSEWPTKDGEAKGAALHHSEPSEKDNSPKSATAGGGGVVGKGPRQAIVAGGVDLQVAWKLHAKQITQQDPGLELSPMLRLVQRSKMETVWEFLDDPDSSRGAWWACFFLKLVVCIALLFSCLQVTKEPLMHPAAFAVWETVLDSLFLCEMVGRIISTPFARAYVFDPLNWADMLSVCAWPFRIATGFVIEDPLSEDALTRILMFIVPLVRFVKLLRYFEIFRLLIAAFKNSAEALPVLAYIMSLITLLGATAIYLAEDDENIPYFQQAIWLAIVTMTSVGYGDFFPKTTVGYIVVSILTFVSVLFLAIPVGIIGYEFTSCWQSRHRVLLITKVRKCLEKWGYSAKDVRILFDYVDANGDGTLNLTEFIELIRQMRIGVSVESAFDIFTLFDDDNNGTLDATEFLRHIFPEEYVKDQQEKQSPPRKSRAVVGEALQHLETVVDRRSNFGEQD